MINVAALEENYARMGDQELIRLCEEEGHLLAPEAITTLYREFLKRGLDLSIFQKLRAHQVAKHQEEFLNKQSKKEKEFWAEIWEFCFEAKLKGKPDSVIFDQLVARGFNGDQSFAIIKLIEHNAEIIRNKATEEAWLGAIISVIGILILSWVSSMQPEGANRFLLTLPLIYGAVKLLSSLNVRSKFLRVLQTIRQDETAQKK